MYKRKVNVNFIRRLISDSVTCKTFNKIPGPLAFPVIGTLWKYFPYIGNYKMKQLDVTGLLKLHEYGEIVKESMGSGVHVVNIFKPEDIEAVFRLESRLPERRSHLAISHYRLTRPHLYNSAGLFPTNGEEWWKLRQVFQKPVSPLQQARLFLSATDKITSEFLNKLFKPGQIVDFLPEVSKLNLELIWQALFGERLNCFESPEDSEAVKIIHHAEACNEAILLTDSTEIVWKKIKTSTYKEFEKNLEFLEKIAMNAINEVKEKSNAEKKGESIVDHYLRMPEVNDKDILGMVVDLLLGGVDTTSYTACFLMYYLSTAEGAQDKLYSEACSLLSESDTSVTSEMLNKAVYSRAILKETFRLNPISIGTSRILKQDIILSGYFVPAGTIVLTQNMVACRLEKYFVKPDVFLPERWIKGNHEYNNVSPFLVLPFGHGIRTCIARRRAEQNLLILLLQIGRKYKLRWTGGRLGVLTPLINKPDAPVSIFVEKR